MMKIPKLITKLIDTLTKNKSEGEQDVIVPHILNLRKMSKKNEVRPVTIEKTTNFLNFLRNKSFKSVQMGAIAKEHNVRSGIHIFAEKLGLAKNVGGTYTFKDIEFEPIHARRIAKMSNEYNANLTLKKIQKSNEEFATLKIKESELIQSNDTIINDCQFKLNEQEKFIAEQGLFIIDLEVSIRELKQKLQVAEKQVIVSKEEAKKLKDNFDAEAILVNQKLSNYNNIIDEHKKIKQLLSFYINKD